MKGRWKYFGKMVCRPGKVELIQVRLSKLNTTLIVAEGMFAMDRNRLSQFVNSFEDRSI